MRSITYCLALALHILCLHSINAQSSTESPDAYQIINKSIDAMGGKAYLQSIKTLYTNFATEMGGRPVNWVVKEMLPNKGSFQIVFNDKVVYQNRFNGTTGYEVVGGEKKPMDASAFKDKMYKKNIFNELDYLDTTLWKIELIGEEKTGGEACYKIKANCVDGTIKTLYFSKPTFLLLKEETKTSESENTVLFSGFKKFGKLTFYTEIKMGSNGQFQSAKLEKLLVNESVENKDFN